MAKKAKKDDCCADLMSLPEEMEAAVRQRGGLDELKSLVPERESLASEAELFQALSEPIRLQILHALLETALCPCLLKENHRALQFQALLPFEHPRRGATDHFIASEEVAYLHVDRDRQVLDQDPIGSANKAG